MRFGALTGAPMARQKQRKPLWNAGFDDYGKSE
jgi:hypothetical protein